MTNKEFYRAIERELLAHTEAINPEHVHLLKSVKITSLELALDAFKVLFGVNLHLSQEAIDIQKQIDEIMSVNGIDESDLDA